MENTENKKCSICEKELTNLPSFKLEDGYICNDCCEKAKRALPEFNSSTAEDFSAELIKEEIEKWKCASETCTETQTEGESQPRQENEENPTYNAKDFSNDIKNITNNIKNSVKSKMENSESSPKEEKKNKIAGTFLVIWAAAIIIALIVRLTGGNDYIEAIKAWKPYNNNVSVEHALLKTCEKGKWNYLNGEKIVQYKGKGKYDGEDVLIQFKITKLNKKDFHRELYKVFVGNQMVGSNELEMFFYSLITEAVQ